MNRTGAGGKTGNGSGLDGKSSVRWKRVELLKEKVEKGTYRVRPMKVAERMIEDALHQVRSRNRSG